MRVRRTATALAAALVLGAVGVGAAEPRVGPVGPGFLATENVHWVTSIPLNADSAGARIVGKTLFITDDRGLTTYDISTPTAPKIAGFLAVPQTPYVPEEDVDTNGKILLIGSLGVLHVIDVRNPAAPKELATVEDADDFVADDHTITCVLDCSYAWGNSGTITDLRDPSNPRFVGDWTEGTPAPDGGHDVTEVSPGIVVTSSNPMLVLDARKNPAEPTVLAVGRFPDDRFIHGNVWPRQGKDRWLLVGGETAGNCGPDAGGFQVFDTKGWQKSKKLTMVDEFHLSTGLPTEGNSPYDQFCAHWFSENPTWRDGGLLAMGWYEHGTRFLDVNKKTGKITEKGWFYPLLGSTSAAYWVTKDVLYAVDYQRGIDILTFDHTKSSTRVVRREGSGAPVQRRPKTGLRFETALSPEQARFLCPLPA